MLVYFDDVPCTDYGLTLLHREIGMPEPKVNMVEVPYADGDLDLTDYFGTVRMKDREIVLTFEVIELDRSQWPAIEDAIFTDLHGKRMQLKFQDDEDYYWDGRCTVETPEDHISTFGVTMSFLCKPYKIEVEDVQDIS